jgi:hypothetical protein
MKKKILSLLLFLIIGSSLAYATSIYDMNEDDIVDYEDALEVWAYHTRPYDEKYDVNNDDIVDYEDALEVWANCGDTGDGETIIDWFVDIIWN